jgi:beta-galactosidase/beta-glucuronidase
MLAIRLDNPPESSRWYPGGGIYRNVWLTKTAPIHVAHWGTHVRTARVSRDSAEVSLEVAVDNDSRSGATVSVATAIYALDEQETRSGQPVAAAPASGRKGKQCRHRQRNHRAAAPLGAAADPASASLRGCHHHPARRRWDRRIRDKVRHP